MYMPVYIYIYIHIYIYIYIYIRSHFGSSCLGTVGCGVGLKPL